MVLTLFAVFYEICKLVDEATKGFEVIAQTRGRVLKHFMVSIVPMVIVNPDNPMDSL